MIYTGLDFGEFKGDSRPASRQHDGQKENMNNTIKLSENDNIPDRKISTSPIMTDTPNEGTIYQLYSFFLVLLY